jgi:hypothetical protein
MTVVCHTCITHGILVFGPLWGMRLLVPKLVVPGHVVSEIRGVRFSGFPFEWDMAYNNLPCTTVQAVMRLCCLEKAPNAKQSWRRHKVESSHSVQYDGQCGLQVSTSHCRTMAQSLTLLRTLLVNLAQTTAALNPVVCSNSSVSVVCTGLCASRIAFLDPQNGFPKSCNHQQ